MSYSLLHCPDFANHCNSQSPFKMLCLDFYDGPIKGVLQCPVCLAEYLFDMIDWDERDDGNDVRIFSLSPLPLGSLEKLVNVFPKGEGSKWPVWFPSWEKVSEKDKEHAAEILSRVEPPELIVAWQGYWGNTILTAKNLDPQGVSPLEHALKTPRRARMVRDWFAFLGLKRSPTSASL